MSILWDFIDYQHFIRAVEQKNTTCSGLIRINSRLLLLYTCQTKLKVAVRLKECIFDIRSINAIPLLAYSRVKRRPLQPATVYAAV